MRVVLFVVMGAAPARGNASGSRGPWCRVVKK